MCRPPSNMWNSHKLFVVSPPLAPGKSPIVWVMWTEKGIWKYKCLNLSRCIWQVCFLWSHMYIVYQDSDCLWMKASKGLCHWHSVNDVDTVAFNIISQFFSVKVVVVILTRRTNAENWRSYWGWGNLVTLPFTRSDVEEKNVVSN